MGWISANDELPSVGERVLILSKYGHIADAELYEYESGVKVFDPFGYEIGKDIKYWMPLPEPPKEG